MIRVKKPALSEKRSYVLKTSALEAALLEAHLDCHVDLTYWTPNPDGSILEAWYLLPNENVPYSRVHLRAGSLLRAVRHDAFTAMQETVLPAFVDWLSRVLVLPEMSPVLVRPPYFEARYRDGAVQIRHDVVGATA